MQPSRGPIGSSRELIANSSSRKQNIRRADGFALVRLKREQGIQDRCFSSQPFVLCGYGSAVAGRDSCFTSTKQQLRPLDRRTPRVRRSLRQDRIVPLFLATLAVRQKFQRIRFRSGSEMLAACRRVGKEYRRLIASFERIFGATMFFGTASLTGKAKVVQRSRFNFLREVRIWYNRSADEEECTDEIDNALSCATSSMPKSWRIRCQRTSK
jgi:hypothetical protein